MHARMHSFYLQTHGDALDVLRKRAPPAAGSDDCGRWVAEGLLPGLPPPAVAAVPAVAELRRELREAGTVTANASAHLTTLLSAAVDEDAADARESKDRG